MEGYARFVARRPGLVLALVALLSAAAGAGVVDLRSGTLRLELDPSLNALLPRHDEARHRYETLLDRFGSDDDVVLAVEFGDAFSAGALEAVEAISDGLLALPEVSRVVSLATAMSLRERDGDLEIEPFLETPPQDAAGREALRRRVLEHPIHGGQLVSRDGRVAAIVVHLRDLPEAELVAGGVHARIAEVAERHAGGAPVWSTGTPVIKAETSRLLRRDVVRISPAVVALMLAVAWLSLRTLAGTLVPVATILLALLWTLGAMAWSGHAINVITSIVPPLVLVVGFAYVIHVVAKHHQEAAYPPPRGARELARDAVAHVGFPVVLTGVTTAVGFLSLTANDLEVIREFGIYAAVGVVASLVAGLTFAPAVLALSAAPRPPTPVPSANRDVVVAWIDAASARLAAFDVRHRRAIVLAGVAVLGVALLGASRIQVNTRTIDNFEPDAPVRVASERVNEILGGANRFYVMLEADAEGAFKEPEQLAAVDALQRALAGEPGVAGTLSAVDYLLEIQEAFLGIPAAERRVPGSRELAAQLLFFGSGDEIGKFLDTPARTATVLVRTPRTGSRELGDLVRRIRGHLDGLPPGVRGTVTGNAVLVTRAADAISRGQVWSLAMAFTAIYAILAVYFRSPWNGLVALVPNALPVAAYFGVMGFLGIALGNATALLGCVALGIAVDDTIHLLVNYRRAADAGAPGPEAVRSALHHVIRPVTYTTVVLSLGLLVMATSGLQTQVHFGSLGAFALAFAWLVDVVFTPALCCLVGLHGGRAAREAA